jgi:hypothetical protein
VPLLKEMLLALDLARVAGTRADRRAADRLQRRLMHDDLKESGLLPVGAVRRAGWWAAGVAYAVLDGVGKQPAVLHFDSMHARTHAVDIS